MNSKKTIPAIIALCSLFWIGSYSTISAQSKTGPVKATGMQGKTVEGSKNLNGAGKAELVIDESDFGRRKGITLLQLLEENIEGFGEAFAPKNARTVSGSSIRTWQIKGFKVNFVFDGLNVDDFYVSHPLGHFGYLKDYLESVTTKDLLGVEVMNPGKYGQVYNNKFKNMEWRSTSIATVSGDTFSSASVPVPGAKEVWIEITTRDHDTKINEVEIGSEVTRRKP